MSERQVHGPEQAYYDNLGPYGQQPVILCLCGDHFTGGTWASVGEDFDAHLERAEEEP